VAALILLTGATGTVGSALLRRLVAAGRPVRCLVREPKRLGAERVRVQIALGDLADPASFRNALRGVDTVVLRSAESTARRASALLRKKRVGDCRLAPTAEKNMKR